MELRPSLFCLFFCLLYFFLPPLEDLGCFSGCLMSSAGIQKLFCGIYSAFKCFFGEFVGEKVFSPSYSSTIFDKSLLMKVKEEGEKADLKLNIQKTKIMASSNDPTLLAHRKSKRMPEKHLFLLY